MEQSLKEQQSKTARRKDEHISICLERNVQSDEITTGLEKWRFKHNALPEINFDDINIETTLFGKSVATPFMVSSMTGGTQLAGQINRQLALACQEKGWTLALGSMRAAIERDELLASFQMREYAPTIPIIANIGLVQLNYGIEASQCMRAVEAVGADALVFHLNSMQEVFQPEGDVNFSGLLRKLEKLIAATSIPIGIKEVGWGIDQLTAKKLEDIGVSFIDVAGAGGTSWSQVERYRTTSSVQYDAAASFSNWGISTADSLVEVIDSCSNPLVFGSGGLKNGVDAAKILALGGHLAGFGRSILQSAVNSLDDLSSGNSNKLLHMMNVMEYELKVTMFGIGARNLSQLKKHERLYRV